MNSLFDKLNLRPQERRLVVIVGIVVFVVLNFWLVFPMFGDYGRLQERTRYAHDTLGKYETEIKKRPAYEKELKELEGQGASVATEEQALRLLQDVNSQSVLSGVTISTSTPMQRGSGSGKTNAFFEEQTVVISVNTGEKELIDFLYRLADKELLIRAKSMDISPDPSHMRLQGRITLVKSFQRKQAKPAAAAASASTKPPAPAIAPASAPKTNVPATVAPPTATPVKTTNAPPVPPKAPGIGTQSTPPPVAPPLPAGITNRPRRLPPTPIK